MNTFDKTERRRGIRPGTAAERYIAPFIKWLFISFSIVRNLNVFEEENVHSLDIFNTIGNTFEIGFLSQTIIE